MDGVQHGNDGCPRGKLIWAGRAWAQGGLVQDGNAARDTLAEECRAFGIDPALLDRAADEDAGIWPEHMGTVQAFLAVAGQWRTAVGQARIIYHGLDYTAVRAGLKMAGIALTPAQWGDVQLIEAGAVAALNEV